MTRVYVPCCAGPVSGSGTPGGGGGGGETLAQTLALGQVTGGRDIILSTGDVITSITALDIVAGDAQMSTLSGGAAAVGQGGEVVVSGGASSGPGDVDGADVTLAPTAGVGLGDDGIARVGSRAIITRAIDAGAGNSLIASQTAGDVDGSDLRLRTLSAGSGITLTPTAGDIEISAGGAGADTRPPWLAFRHFWQTSSTSLRYAPFFSEDESAFITAPNVRMLFDGVYTLERVLLWVTAGGTNTITMGFHLNNVGAAVQTVVESVPVDTGVLFDFTGGVNTIVAGQFVALSVNPSPGNRDQYRMLSTWARV